MLRLERALVDISHIRSQLAAGTMFRGFGPTVIAVTGGMALCTAIAQSVWPEVLGRNPLMFIAGWVLTAVLSVGLIGAGMIARSRRHHGGLADAMIQNAIMQFFPAGLAGAVITLVLLEFTPENIWILPGLWQMLIALGIFASIRSLPRSIAMVGPWYFAAGTCVLIVSSIGQSLSPWLMGLPFAAGQFLMALVLYLASGENHAED